MGKIALNRGVQILAALVVVALAIGLYKAKSDAAHTESHVRALETQIAETEADLRALRADIARAESPGRIEALAERELGLIIGEERPALPEQAIDERLPAARAGGGRAP
jgi:cell division protein FtsL